MGAELVGKSNAPAFWMPVKTSATVYVGSIVTWDYSAIASDAGVKVREMADGALDTTNKDRPFGIVIDTNRSETINNATYKANYITAGAATDSHGSTTTFRFSQGCHASQNDKRAWVLVQLIQPGDLIKMPIWNNAVGTAITLLTATGPDTNGTSVTTNATQFTPVDNMGTIFCRTGANRGQYRITNDVSTTVAAWDVAMVNDIATGDTFVRVPLRLGPSFVRLGDDTVCSYINASKTPATDYDLVHVVDLNLEEAGKEYAVFMFDGDHFASARA